MDDFNLFQNDRLLLLENDFCELKSDTNNKEKMHLKNLRDGKVQPQFLDFHSIKDIQP